MLIKSEFWIVWLKETPCRSVQMTMLRTQSIHEFAFSSIRRTFHGSPSNSMVMPFLISDVSMATPREVGTRDWEIAGANPVATAAIVTVKTAEREKRAILSDTCTDWWRIWTSSKIRFAESALVTVMAVGFPTTTHTYIGDPDTGFPSYWLELRNTKYYKNYPRKRQSRFNTRCL